MAVKHYLRLISSKSCPQAALVLAHKPISRALPQTPSALQIRSVYRGTNPINPAYRNRAAPLIVDRLSQFTKDEEINAYQVCVRGPEAEGGHVTLSEPQILRQLLRNLDREKQCIIQLSKPGTTEHPVVQIAEKDDLRKQVRDREKHIKEQQKESRDKKPKQIEMNWAIDGHDLGIKIKQLDTFLEKGKKVEILLASKRKGRKADQDEAVALLKQIRSKLVEMDAKEVKAMEGEVLRHATMTVQKRVYSK